MLAKERSEANPFITILLLLLAKFHIEPSSSMLKVFLGLRLFQLLAIRFHFSGMQFSDVFLNLIDLYLFHVHSKIWNAGQFYQMLDGNKTSDPVETRFYSFPMIASANDWHTEFLQQIISLNYDPVWNTSNLHAPNWIGLLIVKSISIYLSEYNS